MLKGENGGHIAADSGGILAGADLNRYEIEGVPLPFVGAGLPKRETGGQKGTDFEELYVNFRREGKKSFSWRASLRSHPREYAVLLVSQFRSRPHNCHNLPTALREQNTEHLSRKVETSVYN